jgi:hypothetical protein
MTLSTPLGLLVALAALLPLAALARGRRLRARVRAELGFAATPRERVQPAALVAALALLALAAAQPALTGGHARVRTDAAVLFVVDTSRSMLAGSRLDAARSRAIALRAAVPELPAGVATLTDRVLPDLLPTADADVFATTLRRAVRVDEPPPQELQPVVTTFEPLGTIPGAGYFAPSTHRRIVVLLTDGESEPYAAPPLAGIRLLVARVGSSSDRIPGEAYRPQPPALGPLFAAGARQASAGALRDAAGSGPTTRTAEAATTPLAPWLAGAALVPLAAALARRLRWLSL